MLNPKFAKPLDLAATIAAFAVEGINFAQSLNQPVTDRIEDLKSTLETIKKNPEPIGPVQVEELQAKVKSLEAVHSAVSTMQGQIAESKPLPPVVQPLPPVPSSTEKQWYQSKKFQAFLLTIAAEVLLPMVASFGMPSDQVELMQKFIGITSAFLIGGQTVIDAVAAHADGK